MNTTLELTVNGQPCSVTTDDRRPLLDVLREDLHLTGTRYGCGEGQCGACTVLVDGQRTFACLTPAADVQHKAVTTIEGLAPSGELHPVQRAFLDEGAFQCGYCTSGMIMAAAALLKQIPHPSEAQVRGWMNGNLCRCCGYTRILAAVQNAAAGAKRGQE